MSRPATPLTERFWKYVQKTDGCWLWTGGSTGRGYGQVARGPRGTRGSRVASRVSWELNCGPIPPGMCVCHHCDTPLCVRPSHLFLGTVRENSLDMSAKGRWRNSGLVGSAWAHAKLTEDQVLAIRSEVANSTHRELAARYGVSTSAIGMIATRRSWRHI